MVTKQELHWLVEAVPEDQRDTVARLLRELADPGMLALLQAPDEDEPIAPDEEDAAHQAKEEYRWGKARPWEEVRTELAGD